MFGMEKKKPISPIEFTDSVQMNPISFMDKDINGETNFAIMKTTAGGKFVRGNMLYFKLDSVEVYTDINNIIFVDTENHSMFIRGVKEVFTEIAPDNPGQKEYIILYTDLGYDESKENSDNEFPLRWERIQGRTNVYESIKINAPVIDVDKSLILVDSVGFSEALSVRAFVNYIKNADMVPLDDGFDINEYSGSEYI